MTTRVSKQSVSVVLAPAFVPRKIRVTETNLAPEVLSESHEHFLVVPSETFETVTNGTFRTKIR